MELRLNGKKRAVYMIVKYHNVLRAFAEVERISTAAGITGYSRNTVSKVVKEFVEFGLLEKSGGGVSLTRLGQVILRDVEELFEVLQEDEAEAEALRRYPHPRPERR